SDGIVSPVSTTTTSPTLRLVPGTRRKLRRSVPIRSFAWVSVRVRRNASACALPRPSATASAKFANSTVNHSHTTIWNSNSRLCPPVRRSRNRMTVVSAVTTSRTNITGFVMRVRGSSLTKAEPIAGKTILGSSRAETGIRLRNVVVSIEVSPRSNRSEQRVAGHREMLDDGSERERRKECESADDDDHAHHQAHEQAASGREGAGRWGHRFLGSERAGDRHGGDDHPEAADEHRDGAGQVVEQDVAGEAAE